jgi:signal transduction histidine kinase/ligand-binding sensor domain-containing protein
MARILAALLGLLLFASSAAGERLPIRLYSVADGLPHIVINRIVRDSRGFLWFCTNDGISLFDGYRFTNFGVADGLPHSTVRDVLETRDGEYWVASSGGVSRFNPRGAPRFITIRAPAADSRVRTATVLLQARDGNIWVGSLDGLMRVERTGLESRLVRVELAGQDAAPASRVTALLEDRHETLWVGTDAGLYRRWKDGRAARYGTQDGLPSTFIHDFLEDRQGRLWVATRDGGFFMLANDPAAASLVVTRRYHGGNGYLDWVFDLFERADGRLAVATNLGLYEFQADDAARDGPARMYTNRHGFSYHEIQALAEDRDGNLWLGSQNGAMKVARGGFATLDERDDVHFVTALFESSKGELHAFGYIRRDRSTRWRDPQGRPIGFEYFPRLGRFDGRAFTWSWPNVPAVSWSDQDPLILARNGEWWIGTMDRGLFVFPAVSTLTTLAKSRPITVYDAPGGHRPATVFALYEEADGDIWISTSTNTRSGLARWEGRTRTIRNMSETAGLPALDGVLARAFQEDRAGNIWVGFSPDGLARFAANRFTMFTVADGAPAGQINDIHLDRDGRLWIGSSRGGLTRIDDPTASRPVFVNYSTSHGLSSSVVGRVTEDLQGRIYAATGRGIDRLTPATGRITHFTTADGLVSGRITAALRDQSGALWFATTQGVSRLVPEAERPSLAPPIWIRGLRVGATTQDVSVLGERTLSIADIPAEGNQLQIDFAALSFAPGETLRYQYQLEGAGATWSSPTDQRVVHLAGLAPGRYLFRVRALTADGSVTANPAEVAFTILAPVWLRPWFLAFTAVAVGVILYGGYRYRVSRLLELERVRTRIASDLHDDIGAALSRIAVLSEVARHEITGGHPGAATRVSVIAQAAREVLDSMNDIVWAINPRHDRIHGLAQRMRRFIGDVFAARGIAFSFRAPGDERVVRVAADVRRHVFLIFKEAVNNIVRHSGATEADVEMHVDGSRLVLTIRDNGRGFDIADIRDGNGLVSMQDRARAMGGHLDVVSGAGTGTTVRLAVPLNATAREYNRRLGRRGGALPAG